jgi:DNA-binding transcriptional regulator YbjK
VLDAAIRVLGSGGVRALTHRAVDAEAGLASGSTSNYFRSREALLHAVMARVVTVERAGWEQLAASLTPRSPDELADALAQLVEMVTGPARALSVARYALFVEAARDPQLQASITEAAHTIAAWGRRWLVDVGSTDPDTHTAIVLAYLDGVILHRLAYPQFQSEVAGRTRTLLRAILSSQSAT